MNKIKAFIKNNKYLWVTILLTIVVISTIFVFRGIYPFGKDVFAVYDFDSAYVPVYYKLWDILHGASPLLFDWNLGAGLNSFGSLISNSLLMPSSLIIGLFSRSFIPYAMSYIMIIKLVIVSICTYIAFDKMFPKVHGIYKTIFTLNYTFCGWTVFMYSNILYLDVFALFPLFVLAYYRLMKDNKWGMYLIILTLCLLLNYYMSYLILFFIIGITILSLLILDIRERKKKAVLVLLLTLLSLVLSCVLFLPGFMLATSSYRMSDGGIASGAYLGETFLKLVYMAPMVVSIFFTVKQLFVKKDKKINIFFLLLIIYLLIGIFVPQINAMWHTGSYSGFPFRYSFIPSFVFTLISLYYLDKNYKNKNKFKVSNLVSSTLLIGLFVGLAFIYRNEYLNELLIDQVEYLTQFLCIVILFIVSIVTIFIINKNDKKTMNVLLTIFIMLQVSVYGIYFSNNSNAELDDTVLKIENYSKRFDIPNDGYNLVDKALNMNFNFPYVLKRPSMQNRLHFIKEEEVNYSRYLGHFGYDTVINSNGGTIFSNLLMQNKYYLSSIKLDDRLYTLLQEDDGVYLYESKYNLNYIIPYSGNIYNEDTSFIYENNNMLYKELFNKEENLMHLEEDKKVKLKKDNMYYLYSELGFPDGFVESEYLKYANGVLSYGMYVVEFSVNEDIEADFSKWEDVAIAYINVNDYIEFVESINDYEADVAYKGSKKIYKYNAEEDTSLLMPVNYDDSLIIKVNGEDTEYKLNAYNMLSIDVKEGDNEIEISYQPKFLKEGAIISLSGLIILIVTYFTNKKFKYLDKKFILYPLFAITCLIGLVFILKIYIFFWL